MQNFFAFAVLSGSLAVLGWSYITQPLPQDNLKAYQDCSKLHPQRFCAIRHLPSKLEAMERKWQVYEPGDTVDLFDITFQEWRGSYTVMPQKAVTGLVKIRNVKTNSQQLVSASRLRRGKLPPFFIKGLQSR